MHLLTPDLRAALVANHMARCAATDAEVREPDPAPVVKFFNPVGAATWLATELDADGDTLFGLADLGFGCPELGSFSLAEIAALRLPLGLAIERDLSFASLIPLSLWADAARQAGSISQAEAALADTDARLRAALDHLATQELPPGESEGG
ncbi:DUF2958 domain-containing protein [Hephaestia sp. GCM10023244]|uniref:DUF2958 domain-containing protein n=1 Tax=unclassified Hephaestia TaxID=2631281 RepID=UPI0020770527|nr:DUF2958 domain-containing protein [Hephaestia sp. MAHUQ-44]MCM8732432.1 DUF2958 domain-containing protein [Hephaestia sp. MAHUQ-44]